MSDDIGGTNNDDTSMDTTPVANPLPQADPPFGQPDDITADGHRQALDDTHPATDTNIQPEEVYEEGLSSAALASDPDNRSVVADPDADQN